ncbi:hypothetical protein PGN35_007385 [Nodosilinea sp. PGN35]|uniref:hypothetical protein n=1 Tax=Nodosilinea sp. PGN35 TaxID=3020489 RepID=UPI0023B30D92|nr:hypothetical protein [Nodosilinea sp. TSF1-S3]MDF0367095.1 hypothetical protein [Nodosilinea sp. TSF1-S3]
MTTPPGGLPPADEYSLNQIKGIGPTRQQQLQTLLAIATVLDLAAAEAAAIESAFREAGYPINRANAAAWIAQARQLIEAETQAQQAGKTRNLAAEQIPPEETVAEAKDASSPAIAEGWQTQATVLLEFQTHGEEAMHRWRLLNPASQAAVVLTDQASDSLRAWLQHAGHVFFHLPEDEHVSHALRAWFQQQIPIPPLKKSPDRVESLRQEIIDGQQQALAVQVRAVLLLQPPNTTMPIGAIAGNIGFSGSLQANQPFQVEVCLEFPEVGQGALLPDVSYSVEGFAKALTYPHRTIPLGQSQPRMLTSSQTQYKSAIAAAGLPSGLYQLQITIACQGVDIPLAIHEISRLQVI